MRAVHRWSGTLGVSDYRWFNLRDNVSGGTGALRFRRPAPRRLLAEAGVLGLPERDPPVRHGPRRVSAVSAAPEITLHVLPPSHPSMAAEAALRLKGLEFERVDLHAGEHTRGDGGDLRRRQHGPCPGLLVDGEPVHGSRRDPRAARGARARAAALPGADRRRRARGRALGRRGAAGPRPPAALGRAPLPARGSRHVRRRPSRSIRPGPTSRSDSCRATWKYHGISAERLADDLAGPAGQARPRRRAGRGRRDRRRERERRRPADRLDDPRAADARRPRAAARPGSAAERIARRWFPDFPGRVPAGAFPAGWVPSLS